MREIAAKVWEVTPEDIFLPRRDRNAHKGDFGRVCILGGSVGYSGAPILAAQAAVRAGAGLVTVLVPEPVWPVAATRLSSAMPFPLPTIPWGSIGPGRGSFSRKALGGAKEHMAQADAVLIGPGLSRAKDAAWVSRKLTEELTCPLVLDADGINALEGHIDVLDSRRDRLTVLTPHDGEFSRLAGELPGEDRAEAARGFAAAHGCVLVLKGHRTVTAFPDGEVFVNTTGNPGMAKGGSGEWVWGLMIWLVCEWVEGIPAAPWGVWFHCLAGVLGGVVVGEYGVTPADLIAKIPQTLKKF